MRSDSPFSDAPREFTPPVWRLRGWRAIALIVAAVVVPPLLVGGVFSVMLFTSGEAQVVSLSLNKAGAFLLLWAPAAVVSMVVLAVFVRLGRQLSVRGIWVCAMLAMIATVMGEELVFGVDPNSLARSTGIWGAAVSIGTPLALILWSVGRLLGLVPRRIPF